MANHCANLTSDRELGQYWERIFCQMAALLGKVFTPMQLGRADSILAFQKNGNGWNRYTLPDVTVWTAPGEHHEIKHKDPTKFGSFGLEVYRFDALRWFAHETGQAVLYTIHNHALAGGRDVEENDLAHWITVDVRELDGQWSGTFPGFSWVNGQRKKVDIHYWDQDLWQPLAKYWKVEYAPNPQSI